MRNQERVMIGMNGKPSLLVEVTAAESPTSFMFTVVNGGWKGVYTDGVLTIPDREKNEPIECEILTRNQDRLRGEYNDVFNNFHNENYVAKQYDSYSDKYYDDLDDDIAF